MGSIEISLSSTARTSVVHISAASDPGKIRQLTVALSGLRQSVLGMPARELRRNTGGAEHAVMHLLYSRFFVKALRDMGLLDFDEPFVRFRAHGTIVRDGAKMSKSKGNVIIPDEFIEKYGADTFRTYLMFLGPYEEGGDYQDEGIQGPHGFLHRLFDTVTTAIENEAAADPDVERKLHQTIRQKNRADRARESRSGRQAQSPAVSQCAAAVEGRHAFHVVVCAVDERKK